MEMKQQYFTTKELMIMLGTGRTAAVHFGRLCGAERHIGPRRIVFDIQTIQNALDSQTPNQTPEQ